MEKFKFGDIIQNGWASETNPRRCGVYLWSFHRTGRMNPGKHVKLLHDDGKTGELLISDEDKMEKIGTIFESRDREIERLLEIERASKRLAYVVRRSVNSGPLSKDPTQEAEAWRMLRTALGEGYDERGNLVPIKKA